MPPHSINLLIVKTEPVVLASLSISHYLSCRGVLPAHTSAGLDMHTLVAIHQQLPTLPHNYDPGNEILHSEYTVCWSYLYADLMNYSPHLRDYDNTRICAVENTILRALYTSWVGIVVIYQLKHLNCPLSVSAFQQVSAGFKLSWVRHWVPTHSASCLPPGGAVVGVGQTDCLKENENSSTTCFLFWIDSLNEHPDSLHLICKKEDICNFFSYYNSCRESICCFWASW